MWLLDREQTREERKREKEKLRMKKGQVGAFGVVLETQALSTG